MPTTSFFADDVENRDNDDDFHHDNDFNFNFHDNDEDVHIPTMTKSHHGGEMSIMKKVGMCQIPTTHDKLQLEQLAMVSCSTRPQC